MKSRNMLKELLNQKQDAILRNWFHQIAETYPLDGAKFIENKKDQFNNPVGYTISNEIKVLYRQLINGMELEPVNQSLEKIIKIRNVQDFTSSQAVSFVFTLKRAIRDELRSELSDRDLLGELLVFEADIDQMALLAFDIYTRCRESLYEIRFNEIKRRSIQFLRQYENHREAEN